LPLVHSVFQELDPSAEVLESLPEGSRCRAGQSLVAVRSHIGTLLSGERVALNFLQRLCGIATITRRCVDAVAGTNTAITHTRKTTPGLRDLERYAVRVGGGVDNRGSLAEAVLWKDNHWTLLTAQHQTLKEALARAPSGIEVIVEVENEHQLEEALGAGVTHILVDNQSPKQIAEWVQRCGADVLLQASGGITPETARGYAEAGAKLISIGMLTHSAPAAPISCEITLPD
jgi:nicotinate-nucleotide pyrophosphorylase (carboxylating)